MRASVLWNVGEMEVRDVPPPAPGPRDVLVGVASVGFCGTDFHIFTGESNYNTDADERPIPLSEEPQILGHEITGVVRETGAEVTDLAAGDRVVVDQGRNCMTEARSPVCEYCATGVSHQCEFFTEHGITGLPGGFAELLAIPAVNAVRIAGDLDPACAALTEPLACVLHATDTVQRAATRYALDAQAADRRVRTILICGAGPAGLLFVQVLRGVLGFEGRLLVSEINAKKRALAESFGAETIDPQETDLRAAVRELTDGRNVELAIEATGSGAVIGTLPSLIRRQATVLKYGIGHAGQTMDVMNRMQWKEAAFLLPAGASGGFDADGRPAVYRRALRLIEEGTVDVGALVSHRYEGLAAVPRAFAGDHHLPEYVKGVALL